MINPAHASRSYWRSGLDATRPETQISRRSRLRLAYGAFMLQPPSSTTDEPITPPAVTPFDAEAPPSLEIRTITALRVIGKNVQFDLPEAQERFTLGVAPARAADLTLDGASLSRLHALVCRFGLGDALASERCAASSRSPLPRALLSAR